MSAVAVVDLGAQCALMLVARRGSSGGLEVIEDHALHPRLAAGLSAGGEFDPAAVARTLDVLATYARRAGLARVPPERRRLVATSPLRMVRDGAPFARAAEAAFGAPLVALDPAEEARLARVGAVGGESDAFVLEIGGGSVQCSAPSGGLWTLAIGARTAAEEWLGADGAPPRRDGGASALFAAARAAFRAWPPGAARGGEVALVGGTAVNLGCILAAAESFDPRVADGVAVDAERALAAAERVVAAARGQRLDLPIEPARVDVLPAGLALVAAGLERLAPLRARVSTRGLRHGLAAELLLAAPA